MSNIHLELLHLAQDKDSDANPTYLLNQGANPNYRDNENHKWTPLHYAVFLNKENFALALLSHPRTNALLLDSDGFSALYWAAKKSTPKIISALLSKGCDPNERDMHGMTALFAAVASNKKENVLQLISHPSIDVNQVNQFGGSALHHTAFATDNICIADILVNRGGNLWLIDYENQYPLHVAKRRKRENLFKYFQNKMLLQKPKWKCPINFFDLNIDSDETSVTTEDDEKTIKNIIPPQSVTDNISVTMNNDKSNGSTDSGFSRQSSDDEFDININKSPKQGRYNSAPLIKSKKDRKYKSKKDRKMYSQSPPAKYNKKYENNKYKQQYVCINNSHANKMKQLQENKFRMALKIEQANLNHETRDLLQEQQIYFQYEQEVFYTATQQQFSDFRREIESLKHDNMKLIQQNTELQHKQIKLNMALAYQHGHHGHHQLHNHNININQKYNNINNKYRKEFKKWFKKEIGLMEYFSCFIENGFEDLKTIRHITNENELKRIGIDKMGHRLHILHIIDKYRNKYQNNNHEIAQPAFVNCVSSPINKSNFNFNNNNNNHHYDEGNNNHTGN